MSFFEIQFHGNDFARSATDIKSNHIQIFRLDGILSLDQLHVK